MKIKLMIAIVAMAMTGFCAQAQTADSVQTAPTQQTEVKVPVNNGDNLAFVKEVFTYIKAKFLACKSVEELAALGSDPVIESLETTIDATIKLLTPEQVAEFDKWTALPENNIRAVVKAKMKELIPEE